MRAPEVHWVDLICEQCGVLLRLEEDLMILPCGSCFSCPFGGDCKAWPAGDHGSIIDSWCQVWGIRHHRMDPFELTSHVLNKATTRIAGLPYCRFDAIISFRLSE